MMLNRILFIVLIQLSLSCACVDAQSYFPPATPGVWDTISPSRLGWCNERIDSLYQLLAVNNTKAFILLKDGKIVLEKYFNNHTPSSLWYWASAGKSLTSFVVGLAQQDGYLSIDDQTSKYLGTAWTSCTPEQESKIKIRNQLTMTTGLNDAVSEPDCTVSSCLQYKDDAGNRWAYHNAAYTLLDQVIENATGKTFNQYINLRIKTITGMDGQFIKQGYNNVFFSTARSMARYGLLILNRGTWNQQQILMDQAYFNNMISTSQNLNLSYGYLWWLNGKSTYMIPQTQFVFRGSLNPNAPADMFAALGKNGQFINVIPSQNMVWIRMGEAPDNSLVPFTFNDDIWTLINSLKCNISSVHESQNTGAKLYVTPNPSSHELYIRGEFDIKKLKYQIFDHLGRKISEGSYHNQIDISNLPKGYYSILVYNMKQTLPFRFVKI